MCWFCLETKTHQLKLAVWTMQIVGVVCVWDVYDVLTSLSTVWCSFTSDTSGWLLIPRGFWHSERALFLVFGCWQLLFFSTVAMSFWWVVLLRSQTACVSGYDFFLGEICWGIFWIVLHSISLSLPFLISRVPLVSFLRLLLACAFSSVKMLSHTFAVEVVESA